jgi:hypothetical protein
MHTIDQLPLGASCVVTETGDGGADSTTARVGAGAAIDGLTVAVAVGDDTVITFENTFDSDEVNPPPPTTTTTTTMAPVPPPTTTTTTTTTDPPARPLPITGGTIAGTVLVALVMLGAGFVFLAATRRRRTG